IRCLELSNAGDHVEVAPARRKREAAQATGNAICTSRCTEDLGADERQAVEAILHTRHAQIETCRRCPKRHGEGLIRSWGKTCCRNRYAGSVRCSWHLPSRGTGQTGGSRIDTLSGIANSNTQRRGITGEAGGVWNYLRGQTSRSGAS